jgi:hypothetical protein
MPAHKENKHEARRKKKSAQAQKKREAPGYEEVLSGEEIKGYPSPRCLRHLRLHDG